MMWKPEEDEFFIGYDPPMPRRYATFIRRIVIGIAAVALLWAVTVAAGHVPLEGGIFEYGRPQRLTGRIVERPYPALRVDEADAQAATLLLVAPGKHGADALVRGLDGRRVSLIGTRIQRGAHAMIEVEPGSIVSRLAEPGAADALLVDESTDPVTLTGEIVDSKCFLGVMVPGSGKTHKGCASLCLRGGIPPALHVHDQSGRSAILLLTGASGESLKAQAVQFAGEAITVTGSVGRQNGWLVLRTDPATWRPIGR
jgi:hypothetical protein